MTYFPKVFDYSYPKKGWVEFPDMESAKKYVQSRLDDEWHCDRDNYDTATFEIFDGVRYRVYRTEFGTWWEINGDEMPYRCDEVGSREDYPDFNFTDMDPRKDYILI